MLVVATFLLLAIAALPLTTGTANATNPTVTVKVLDSHGNGLPGVLVTNGNGNAGWYFLGTTDASGVATGPLASFGGPIQFAASYNQGTATSPVITDLSGDPDWTFHTVSVTLLGPSPIIYATNGNSGWHTYTGPMEMFPGTYLMNSSQGTFPFTVGTSNFTGGNVRLIDHNGNGLAGGTIWTYPQWAAAPGQTDANGNLFVSMPSSNYLHLRMYYGGTTTMQSLAQLTASGFTFQTTGVSVRLKDHAGGPLAGGSASYYAQSWHTIGNTGAGGDILQEMLPGSYSFAMVYNHTRQQMNGVSISGSTTDVVFQTGRAVVNYSGAAQWYYSGYYSLNTPQELLPGTRPVYLYGSPLGRCTTSLTVASGDDLVKSGIVATLTDSNNHPLAGGSAFVNSYTPLGVTDSGGRVCGLLPGTFGNTAVRMFHNGTTTQYVQNQPANSIFAFKTIKVDVQLHDHNGASLNTGTASYYANGWHAIGTTSGGSVSVQMLPGPYSFGMLYKGTYDQLNAVNVSTTNPVIFQTGLVTSGGHATGYYANGWQTFNGSAELLSGTWTFSFDNSANAPVTVAAGVNNPIN